jgi:translation initiation factor 6 (eIF-6)
MNLKNTIIALLAMSSSLLGQTITTNTNNLTVPWSTSFSGFQGITNASKAFRVTASNLTTNITAFTNTLSMASNSSNALLWVRMSGSNVGTFTNTVTLTSAGANTNATTITGTVVASLASVMYDKATALIVRPTNLGLNTNVTFVDAATNTNTVSISNGIITGWTQ